MLEVRVNLSQKLFSVGFFLGIGIFVAANVYSYYVAVAPCCDFEIPFGVPIPLGLTGGFTGGTRFIVLGVIADVIAGLLASLVFAWVFTKLIPPVLDLFRRTVQWHVKTSS